MTLRVGAVANAAARRLFERIPELLHGADPAFVPPYPGSVARYLRSDSAFARVHGEVHGLLAWRGNRPVGRIAAVLNRTHNRHAGDRTGFFGFFACEDNADTARALFAAAEAWLRDRGCDAVRGPYNPSINDECGLLVEDFATPPFLGLTWNPAYYAALVEGAGFKPVRRLLGFNLPLAQLTMSERVSRLAAHVARRSKLVLRRINLRNIEPDLAVIREVYNHTLERNWGFVPISMDDMREAAADLKAIANPEMIRIAEKDGEPAGVGLSLPNVNELCARLGRTPEWLRPLHFLWLLKTRRIRSARQVVYGILPRFRDRGLHAWLLYEQFRCAQEGYEHAQLGWIEENNEPIIAAAREMGGVPARAWLIYERPL